MTQQASYAVNLRIKLEDKKNLELITKKGKTTISVFRSGIATELKKIKKGQ